MSRPEPGMGLCSRCDARLVLVDAITCWTCDVGPLCRTCADQHAAAVCRHGYEPLPLTTRV